MKTKNMLPLLDTLTATDSLEYEKQMFEELNKNESMFYNPSTPSKSTLSPKQKSLEIKIRPLANPVIVNKTI
jgi:hypothetical protein